MEFKSITIKNFRNFENITLDLTNKNVFFGMNDVGKTNFLYALRFVFDKEIRRNNFIETDYFKKDTGTSIEILITIDIADTNDNDNKKLRAKLKGAMSSNQDNVHIKLVAEYDKKEMVGIPMIYWGGDINDLEEMKSRGIFYDIDHIFNVYYIDAYVELNALFRKNINTLLINDSEEDKMILENIDQIYNTLNNQISNLSGIKNFENNISPEYKKYRNEDVSIKVKSEIAVKGLYSNIVPYIKKNEDEMLYPTSGEGRKKLLVYSIFDILSAEEKDKKINLFMIEEPENHLHRSMQLAVSHELFTSNKYKYLFMTTHSPYVLTDMDHVNLIRIYNEDKIESKSVLYNVPDKFKNQRKMLNRGLVEAIFSDKVLLVEGPSEHILFERVLAEQNPYYESEGIYILPVDGIGFKPYVEILKKLNIKTVIKTDNDLKKVKGKEKYSVLGFTRVNKYINSEHHLPETQIDVNTIESKRKLYNQNKELLDDIRTEYSIYLSKCSLEEDLDEVLHPKLEKYVKELNDKDNDKDTPIEYLKKAKKKNMAKLVEKLTKEDCHDIYNHYNFACLEEVLS